MKLMVMVSLMCVLATGCENSGRTDSGVATLDGTRWRLTAWSASSSDPSLFTITADFSGSRISGTSAVNSYSGPYTVTADGRFALGDLFSTEMAGSEEAMHAESLYFELLRQAGKYVVTASTLTLKDAGNNDILIFNAR